MTPEEESRIFTGPWPWKLPGFVVAGMGVVVCDVPPADDVSFAYEEERREGKELFWDLQEEASEDVEGLSPSELRATIEMTRDELALQWAKLKQTGDKVRGRYDDFREWLVERLREAHRDNPRGAKRPFSSLLTPRARWESPLRLDQWSFVRAQSHRGGRPSLRTLKSHVQSFNLLAGRYRELRRKRYGIAHGRSQLRSSEYKPSPTVEEILQATIELDSEHFAEMDISEAWSYLEESTGRVGVRDTVYQDMVGRDKAPERYPRSTEALLELAREILGKRSPNVVQR